MPRLLVISDWSVDRCRVIGWPDFGVGGRSQCAVATACRSAPPSTPNPPSPRPSPPTGASKNRSNLKRISDPHNLHRVGPAGLPHGLANSQHDHIAASGIPLRYNHFQRLLKRNIAIRSEEHTSE